MLSKARRRSVLRKCAAPTAAVMEAATKGFAQLLERPASLYGKSVRKAFRVPVPGVSSAPAGRVSLEKATTAPTEALMENAVGRTQKPGWWRGGFEVGPAGKTGFGPGRLQTAATTAKHKLAPILSEHGPLISDFLT